CPRPTRAEPSLNIEFQRSATVSTQTETMFLQLPGITGGAQDPKFKNQMAVDSLTWSIGGITDLHASASQLTQQCSTKVFVGDVSIQRKMCVGSPSVLS